jgi:hypothetical protein
VQRKSRGFAMSEATATPLPPCHIIAYGRVDLALVCKAPDSFGAYERAILQIGAPAAVLTSEGAAGRFPLISEPQAVWMVEKGRLDGFLTDPGAHAYLHAGIPVMAVFGDREDWEQLLSLVPELPVSDYERDRLCEALNDAALEARDESEEADPDYDDDDLDHVVGAPGEER